MKASKRNSKDNTNRPTSNQISKPSKKLIYDDVNHLNELIKEIVTLHKNDGYDNFEEISMYIKKKMTKLTLEYEPFPYVHNPLVILTPKEQKILSENTKIKIPKTKDVTNYMDDILS